MSDRDGALDAKLPPFGHCTSGTGLKNTWTSQSRNMRCSTVPSIGSSVHCLAHRIAAYIVKNIPTALLPSLLLWFHRAGHGSSWMRHKSRADPLWWGTLFFFFVIYLFIYFVKCELTVQVVCWFFPKCVLSILIVIPFHVSVIWSWVCIAFGAHSTVLKMYTTFSWTRSASFPPLKRLLKRNIEAVPMKNYTIDDCCVTIDAPF